MHFNCDIKIKQSDWCEILMLVFTNILVLFFLLSDWNRSEQVGEIMKLEVILDEIKAETSDPTLIISACAISIVESNCNPSAVGSAGEIGPFQVHPVHNPIAGDNNTKLAIALLKQAREANASWLGSAMQYNCGHPLKSLELKNLHYGICFEVAVSYLVNLCLNKTTSEIDVGVLYSYDPVSDNNLQSDLSKLRALPDGSLPALNVINDESFVIDTKNCSSSVKDWNKVWNKINAGTAKTEFLK